MAAGDKTLLTLRILDTFSGIGGFSYAGERLLTGFETVQFVEWEPFCQKVLQKHWPLVPIHGDISTFFPERNSADVICGGFPCQDISVAGRQAGIKEGTRSGLFFELMRVIRAVRPKYVVLENVAAIVSKGLDTVLGEMAEAGYDTEWACIPAKDVGAVHKRDRWWLIAYPHGTRTQRQRTECELSETEGQEPIDWSSGDLAARVGSDWRRYISEPLLCRGDDGLSGRVDRLKALGNSIVPQVAAVVLNRVLEIDLMNQEKVKKPLSRKVLSVSVKQEFYDRVQRFCDEQDISVSVFTREAMRRYMAELLPED